MKNKQIIIDGVDVGGCSYFTFTDEHYCDECSSEFGCAICDERPTCLYKQLKRKEQKLERITNMLFIGQCSNCEGYSPNCSNKELCNFKHNIKNIIDEVENEI